MIAEKKVFKEFLNKDVETIFDIEGSCDNCRNGYTGRVAVQEVLLINDQLRDAINNPNLKREDLRKLVYTDEVTTLLQDGLLKVLDGTTTFSEIYKIIEIDNELDTKYGNDAINNNKNSNTENIQSENVNQNINNENIPQENLINNISNNINNENNNLMNEINNFSFISEEDNSFLEEGYSDKTEVLDLGSLR